MPGASTLVVRHGSNDRKKIEKMEGERKGGGGKLKSACTPGTPCNIKRKGSDLNSTFRCSSRASCSHLLTIALMQRYCSSLGALSLLDSRLRHHSFSDFLFNP